MESYSSFDATVVKAYADFLECNHGQSLIIVNKDTDQALDESKEDMDSMDGDYDVEDDNAGERDGDNDKLTGQNRDEEDDARVDEDGEDDDDRENQLSDAFFSALYTQRSRTGSRMSPRSCVKRLLCNALQRLPHSALQRPPHSALQ